ncbi:polysaccharide deacetylase family protein [Dictyobacter aurantiacus]|uniref:NodB homology domain-containing protein n=1 Tax=Dictyobacter aurantiacus TaxID=1936993 RepID=A0A401ZFE7_9CHLR|nr:polysaccharide deacetylase family protein [Dictyobacter aurantiacus]GCE05569.1 hypothetical protein KDAU_28980 [Dictyobacter aurantiacus]
MKHIGKREAQQNHLFFAKFLMVSSIILLLTAAVLAGYLIFSPAQTLRVGAKTTITQHVRQTTPGQYQSEVRQIGQHYMQALFQQQYARMWAMLHPDVQKMWPGEQAFAAYWQRRFHDFRLKKFTMGQVSDLSSWTNAETMKEYEQVSRLPISLQLDPAQPSAPDARTSGALLHANELFRNLPFIVQRVPFGMGRGEGRQWLILNGGPADVEAPILPPANPVAKKVRVPILMYHYISEVPAQDKANPYSYRPGLTVTPTVFSQQLDYFKRLGYHTITFNQLFSALYYDGPLPDKPIIFSFDDGYVDAYTNAYPILRAHGYTGMFYIITGKVGWKGQASWPQLREMLANGMQMGSHTIDHRALGDVWQLSPDDARHELVTSRQTLQDHLQTFIQQFCYPSGDPLNKNQALASTQHQIQGVMALLNETGYVGATNDPRVSSIVQDSTTPYIIHRIRVPGNEDIQSFETEMAPFVA